MLRYLDESMQSECVKPKSNCRSPCHAFSLFRFLGVVRLLRAQMSSIRLLEKMDARGIESFQTAHDYTCAGSNKKLRVCSRRGCKHAPEHLKILWDTRSVHGFILMDINPRVAPPAATTIRRNQVSVIVSGLQFS